MLAGPRTLSLGYYFVCRLWVKSARLSRREKDFFAQTKGFVKNIFFKKEKSVDFKPVESSLRTADLRTRLLPSRTHACKIANSEVLDIQAPKFVEDDRRADEKDEKEIEK